MTDYNQLQSDIGNWLAKDSLTGVTPSFIRLAEARHRREMRITDMMRRQTAFGQDSQFLALPDGYLNMRRLMLISQSVKTQLTQVTPAAFQQRSQGGNPQTFTVHREIEFDAPLSSGNNVEMVFYAAFPALSDTNLTNWLVINAYDAYLYGSLVAAEPYLRNDKRIAVWESGYVRAIKGLMESERLARVSRGGQRMIMAGAW